ncbi:response regulator [bacterium]|nr:response regulator [bacterium]
MENILIIDDDPATTRLLEVLLEREGYKIQTENLSANALQTTKDFGPHLVILDLMMPGTDGMTVCQTMREDPQTQEIPILMFSAADQPELRRKAAQAGVNQYITKPIHPNELKQIIKDWLQKSSENKNQ